MRGILAVTCAVAVCVSVAPRACAQAGSGKASTARLRLDYEQALGEYQAKPAADRADLKHPAGLYRPKFKGLAEKYAGDEEALPALDWLVRNVGVATDKDAQDVGQWALERLIRDHAAQGDIGPVLAGTEGTAGVLGRERLVRLYDRVVERNRSQDARAQALLLKALLLLGGDGPTVAQTQPGARQALQVSGTDRADAVQLLRRIGRDFGAAGVAPRAASCLYEQEHLLVGMKAPELAGKDANGAEVRLSQLRGRVVVLAFWGLWSEPCQALVVEELELVRKMGKAPVALLGVNSDKSRGALAKALTERQITWANIYDGPVGEGALAKAWNVHTWPTIYVLDHEGTIRYRDVRGQALEDAVTELVKKVPAKP
jgi:peroxiredoxin